MLRGFLIAHDIVDEDGGDGHVGEDLRDVFETIDEIKRFWVAREDDC